MIVGVADTHTALWHLFGDPKLSRTAEDFIQAAAARRDKIAVSVISMAGLVYLIEKNRLPLSAYDDLSRALNNPAHVLIEAALTAEDPNAASTDCAPRACIQIFHTHQPIRRAQVQTHLLGFRERLFKGKHRRTARQNGSSLITSSCLRKAGVRFASIYPLRPSSSAL